MLETMENFCVQCIVQCNMDCNKRVLNTFISDFLLLSFFFYILGRYAAASFSSATAEHFFQSLARCNFPQSATLCRWCIITLSWHPCEIRPDCVGTHQIFESFIRFCCDVRVVSLSICPTNCHFRIFLLGNLCLMLNYL